MAEKAFSMLPLIHPAMSSPVRPKTVPRPAASNAQADPIASQLALQTNAVQTIGQDVATVVPNGGTAFELPSFSKLPCEIRALIWESTWEPREVKVKRYVEAHKSDFDCDGTVKSRSRRRHRDKLLHSNAVMLTEWDDSPYLRSIGRDVTVAQQQATDGEEDDDDDEEDEKKKLSHNAKKLANRPDKVQQKDLQRIRTIATTATKPPATLFVNRESRDVTLRRYPLAFALPGGESRVYFNFALDTLVLSRHAQLDHAFAKVDLSRLQRISTPEVKPDDSGDYRAVGRSTDCLIQEKDAEGVLVGDMMSGTTPEEQVEAVFAPSRAVLSAICPKIEQIVFSPITTCLNVCLSTGHKSCARNFARGGVPLRMYKVDHHDETWERGQTTIADCNSHANEPKMKRDFGLTQKRYSAQVGKVDGVLLYRDCRTGGGDVVVSMLSVQHDGLPDLGGPAYHTKMRVYEWGRRVRQAECARINLEWLLGIGDPVRKMQTLDYEL
ncbi:quinate permease [Diaporthe eres]|uniref:2EXR domain-containing protein n=1 Tax=Diaporthe vaccinii TaxID=105482 RepID=A0ABR4ES70_9PEZI|nr:quinate permease [Diaporthe eres]